MSNPFFLRAEYSEYVQDCKESSITPMDFLNWFFTSYHYDMQNETNF